MLGLHARVAVGERGALVRGRRDLHAQRRNLIANGLGAQQCRLELQHVRAHRGERTLRLCCLALVLLEQEERMLVQRRRRLPAPAPTPPPPPPRLGILHALVSNSTFSSSTVPASLVITLALVRATTLLQAAPAFASATLAVPA
mmetsp:Transcript_40994/g.101164  ORF Transcript_40994/g.101164 Transcript_40994/m.101164 type:complete len:144 (-) Transcript_40994:299-730(-)